MANRKYLSRWWTRTPINCCWDCSHFSRESQKLMTGLKSSSRSTTFGLDVLFQYAHKNWSRDWNHAVDQLLLTAASLLKHLPLKLRIFRTVTRSSEAPCTAASASVHCVYNSKQIISHMLCPLFGPTEFAIWITAQFCTARHYLG
jgi:hypothetical protein